MNHNMWQGFCFLNKKEKEKVVSAKLDCQVGLD